MTNAEVAAYIGRWRPSSVSPQAAAFARDVIAKTEPEGRERAKNLLWAAGRLADYALAPGLGLVPEVVFHPPVAERFARCAPGLSGVARRTLRTNQRFIGRHAVPQLYPADVPLPRERSKVPCSPAEVDGYIALADAQPAMERRMRTAGPGCLGAVRRGGVTAAGDGESGLPAFQLEVARVFFALPASKGFLLAGGAALLAQHLTARPTEDLDFFTASGHGRVFAAAMPWRLQPASEAGMLSGSITAARSAGWSSAALTPGSWSTWP